MGSKDDEVDEESESDPVDEDDDVEDDDAPRVVLAKLGDIARWLPEPMAKNYADRPVWFLLGMDAELVSLFERIPEDPMPKGRVAAILEGLRAFAADQNEGLQEMLGITDEIVFGFHVDAPMARVRASFEDDGFEIVATISLGEIKLAQTP